MTEQEMTKAHIKQLVIDMGEAIARDDWQAVIENTTDIRLFAVTQAVDSGDRKAARYGKR